jgi:type VI secretion system protein ImpL
MKPKVMVIAGGALVFAVLLGSFRSQLSHFGNPMVFQVGLVLVGLAGAAVAQWFSTQKNKAEGGGDAGGGAPVASGDDLDQLIQGAEGRLTSAQLEKNAKLSTLPAIFLTGEGGTAKTTTMVNSGLDPELLAGQVYEETNLVATPIVNIWFARHTLFVEPAGKLLADAGSWTRLVKRLQPAKLASVVGKGGQVPRAAVVCIEAEKLMGSADALTVSARTIRARLGEISQALGISLPVYVLFSKSDRVPFFAEYVRNLNNEEATKSLGAMLPMVTARQGLYAEEETNRLSAVFERMFRAMCNARPEFLAREQDPAQLSGIYEFPREFRKLRLPLVRFLVELCKPSQLDVGPFLRGFYFSGVRPVIVAETAPSPIASAAERAAVGSAGATGMFKSMAAQSAASTPRVVGQRKVPQWLFLGHFFNDVLLGDNAAKGASVSSTKTSLMRRILLGSAAGLCLLFSLLLVVSFAKNRALEAKVGDAAHGIAAADSSGANLASLDSLRRLETLRQSLQVLTTYDREGAPLSYRWGLYVGDSLYPEVRRLYFDGFRRLLLGQTQDVLAQSLRGLPDTPGPGYGPTYESLKAYLITTSNHDKSTRSFLSPVLMNRWSANRNVDPERMQLAQRQFDFYSDELKVENPFTDQNDADAIKKARHYLAQFAGFERVYQAMLADAGKNNLPVNFNKRFPGSAETVIDNQEVLGPFTKGGWDFMKTSLKNPEKYFSGEQWVLGDEATVNIDRSKLGQQLADRYHSDFVNAWRAYLKAASVVRFASIADASKKLNTLSGNQSPLLALFWLCSQNTAVDSPEVAANFQPVQAVVPPSSVDRYIAAPNQGYMNALVALQTSLESIAGQPQPSDAAAAQTLTNATAARVTTRQLAQVFRLDPVAHVETTVQKLMEDPITYVEGLLRSMGPAELNAKGKVVCGQLHAVLSKYPFNPSATPEATVAEVNAVFHKPDGALWTFYDQNLAKLLPKQGDRYVAAPGTSINLTPAFVNFFNQAASFGETIYAGGTPDPHFTYSLKPVLTEGIQTLGLTIDGQTLSYSGGAVPPKQFTWQGSGTHGAKATVKFGGSTDLAWSTNDGLWAVFHFIGKADHREPTATGELLEWTIRIGKDPVTLPSGKPLTVRFELDMAGAPPVFQKGFASRLGCVAEVAKP